MKQVITNIISTVPPFVLFMGAVSAVCCWGGLRLLAMLETVA